VVREERRTGVVKKTLIEMKAFSRVIRRKNPGFHILWRRRNTKKKKNDFE